MKSVGTGGRRRSRTKRDQAGSFEFVGEGVAVDPVEGDAILRLFKGAVRTDHLPEPDDGQRFRVRFHFHRSARVDPATNLPDVREDIDRTRNVRHPLGDRECGNPFRSEPVPDSLQKVAPGRLASEDVQELLRREDRLEAVPSQVQSGKSGYVAGYRLDGFRFRETVQLAGQTGIEVYPDHLSTGPGEMPGHSPDSATEIEHRRRTRRQLIPGREIRRVSTGLDQLPDRFPRRFLVAEDQPSQYFSVSPRSASSFLRSSSAV